MRKIISIFLAILTLTILVTVTPCAEIVKVDENGITNIYVKRENIKVTLLSQSVRGETFSYAIKKLNIIVNGVDIGVPKSAYGDLYDPSEAKIVMLKRKKQAYLEITGGDGSESYFVRIYFDNKGVNRRVLYSTILPDKPLEETRYWIREL